MKKFDTEKFDMEYLDEVLYEPPSDYTGEQKELWTRKGLLKAETLYAWMVEVYYERWGQ